MSKEIDNIIVEIEEEIAVLRRDRADFLRDLDAIDEELANLLDDKIALELNNVEDRPNDLSDEEVDEFVEALMVDVKTAIGAGVVTLVAANGDVNEDSSLEHTEYATKERTKWVLGVVISELQKQLDRLSV